jgi:hypothetical protein
MNNDAVYFADAELPFHVWVREGTGADGFRWVLRQAPLPGTGERAVSDREDPGASGPD